MENQEDMENVEQDWKNIKAAILEATKETTQMQPRTTYKEWWDEECRKAIEGKNIARKKKCRQRRTRATLEEYEEKRRAATKICRNKKKHWLNNRIRRIEEAHPRNETRQFYKDIKKFGQAEQAGMSLLICKDDKGNILIEKQQVLKRWKHYLSEALNRELAPDMNNEREMENLENLNEELEIPPPTHNQINGIIQQLRNNKAPGPDSIILELVKEGGQRLKHRICMLMLKIWGKK